MIYEIPIPKRRPEPFLHTHCRVDGVYPFVAKCPVCVWKDTKRRHQGLPSKYVKPEVIKQVEPAMTVENEQKEPAVKLVLGSRLGSGANKFAYELASDPTKVALVSSFKVLSEEIADLKVLEGIGVPVPKVYELHKNYEANVKTGTHESVVLMERFACGSRGDVVSKLCDVLNERSIESIKEIQQKLLAAELYIEDLQFLFRTDGTMVVADPDSVKKIEYHGQKRTLEKALKLAVQKIERGVEYATDLRTGLAPPPEDVDTYAFWKAADKWHSESAEPKARRKAEQEGIYTQTVELVFEEYGEDLEAA